MFLYWTSKLSCSSGTCFFKDETWWFPDVLHTCDVVPDLAKTQKMCSPNYMKGNKFTIPNLMIRHALYTALHRIKSFTFQDFTKCTLFSFCTAQATIVKNKYKSFPWYFGFFKNQGWTYLQMGLSMNICIYRHFLKAKRK